MAPSFRVILRSGPNPGKVFPLEKVELFIGRDLSNDVVINDPEISRRHSRLLFTNGTYLLEDLGSTNGTSVNGQRLVSPTALRHGDLITLGERITLVFEAVAQTGDPTVSAPDRANQSAQNVPAAPQAVYPSAYNAPVYEPAAFPQRPQAPQPPAGSAYPTVQQYPSMPAQPQYQQMPPPPPPAYEPVQPPFSGQIPLSPESEPVEIRTRTPAWTFIVIGILLLIILLLVIDDFRLWTLFGIG
jgi:predicted component of type VI protein secretion system